MNYTLPYPSGIYSPSLGPTPKQKEQMLANAAPHEKERLERIWKRYEYTPSADATEYDGPRDQSGDPDFVCYQRWEASRRVPRGKTFLGTPPSPMLDENGMYTDDYFAYCINVLRYVCDFGESSLPDSSSHPRDYFDSIEGAIETRQVFAMAPKALRAVVDTFKAIRQEDEEWARKRLAANVGPLAPQVAALEAKGEEA